MAWDSLGNTGGYKYMLDEYDVGEPDFKVKQTVKEYGVPKMIACFYKLSRIIACLCFCTF